MKIKLYKVLDLSDNEDCDDLEKTQVLTEKDLRKEFLFAHKHGRIPQELIDDYAGDPDYCDELDDNPELKDLKIWQIIDIMNDICNYDCGEGYYILETEIEI